MPEVSTSVCVTQLVQQWLRSQELTKEISSKGSCVSINSSSLEEETNRGESVGVGSEASECAWCAACRTSTYNLYGNSKHARDPGP